MLNFDLLVKAFNRVCPGSKLSVDKEEFKLFCHAADVLRSPDPRRGLLAWRRYHFD
jgi:hypothetical protein